MTKTEAEAKVKYLNDLGPKWFCPLIQERCVPECINFGEAFVWNKNDEKGLRDIKKDDFEVVGPTCHNAMFTETIICNGGSHEEMD